MQMIMITFALKIVMIYVHVYVCLNVQSRLEQLSAFTHIFVQKLEYVNPNKWN